MSSSAILRTPKKDSFNFFFFFQNSLPLEILPKPIFIKILLFRISIQNTLSSTHAKSSLS